MGVSTSMAQDHSTLTRPRDGETRHAGGGRVELTEAEMAEAAKDEARATRDYVKHYLE